MPLVEDPRRRRFLSRLWIAGAVLYGLVRVALVWQFLSGYGVNPHRFALVELASSVCYGWASARLVSAVGDRNWPAIGRLAPFALAAYLAPDLYVFATIGRVPGGVLASLVTIFCATAAFGTIALVRQVREARRAAEAALEPALA